MLFTWQPEFDPAKFTILSLRLSLIDRSYPEATIEFKDPEDGKNAVTGLDGIEFESEKLKFVVASKQGAFKSLPLCCVLRTSLAGCLRIAIITTPLPIPLIELSLPQFIKLYIYSVSQLFR